MGEALREAALGAGGTRPNPPVGCVVVRDGKIIGRGHHEFAGGPHAEAAAIASLNGADASGAVLYVTLEPCSTHGRTPPCTEAILRSGIRRVVVASVDANPDHRGRGIKILESSGIEVACGVCKREADDMLAPFFKWITTKRPYVSLKMAQSLDGAIADHAGQSKWITGPESRTHVGELRSRADVVLVGCGTVLADDPSLLRPDREAGCKGLPGMRAVLDSTGRIPLSARIFADGHALQTLYVTTESADAAHRDAVSATGATVLLLPTEFPPTEPVKDPLISLEALLKRLGEAGYLHVLCEGGARLASSFINARLVDELLLFTAPVILGAGATRVFGAFPFDLPTAPRFRIDSSCRYGDDILLRAFPKTGG